MTEAQWRTCRYPWVLYQAATNRLSDRQVRLWACACARLVECHFDHRLCGPTIALAERAADGLVTTADRHRAWLAIKSAAQAGREAGTNEAWWGSLSGLVRAVARDVIHADIRRTIQTAMTDIGLVVHAAATATEGGPAGRASWDARHRLDGVMCDLLRDVAGRPDGPPAFQPAWRTADSVSVARGIYEDRAFHRMPILGDALLDAGCDDDDIMNHCRLPGPHAKGCWVIDLVMGKE